MFRGYQRNSWKEVSDQIREGHPGQHPKAQVLMPALPLLLALER